MNLPLLSFYVVSTPDDGHLPEKLNGLDIECIGFEEEADGEITKCEGVMKWEGSDDPGGRHEPPTFGYWYCEICECRAIQDGHGGAELDL
jgi:hypothetical protein